MASEIVVTIGKGGIVTIEGEGYHGPVCDTQLRALAVDLGDIEAVETKPEFFEQTRSNVQTQNIGG